VLLGLQLSMILGMGLPLAAFAEEAAEPATATAQPQPRRAYRAPRAVSPEAALDQRIQLLTAELGLTATQQTGVREALIGQRQQTLKVWQDTSIAAPVRIKLTQDIATHTADRIRALLTDEQREKYIKPRPGEASTAHGESAETWIGRMRGP
jgi:hypothetical protein